MIKHMLALVGLIAANDSNVIYIMTEHHSGIGRRFF